MSTLRGPTPSANLQGALCVPTYNLTNGVVGRTCGGSYRGSLAFVAPAGCRIPATTTRERRLLQGHRRVHGVCTEGRLLLNVGDRGGGNGLRPPLVREAGVAASGRPFSGSGLGSRGLYALCWTDETSPTLALVKALLIAHDEDPGPVFWPNPGGKVGRTKPGETATQRQPRP